MSRSFLITVILTDGSIHKGVRKWTGTAQTDPKAFYSYQARKAYKAKLQSISVQEITDTKPQAARKRDYPGPKKKE
jgi:hypothetical protein